MNLNGETSRRRSLNLHHPHDGHRACCTSRCKSAGAGECSSSLDQGSSDFACSSSQECRTAVPALHGAVHYVWHELPLQRDLHAERQRYGAGGTGQLQQLVRLRGLQAESLVVQDGLSAFAKPPNQKPAAGTPSGRPRTALTEVSPPRGLRDHPFREADRRATFAATIFW